MTKIDIYMWLVQNCILILKALVITIATYFQRHNLCRFRSYNDAINIGLDLVVIILLNGLYA